MKYTSRRTFLKETSLTAAGAMVFSNKLFASQGPNPHELLGVQLYSVRADMTKDPLGTLKQVAAMGYKNVEHANYVDRKFYGYSPGEFRKILDDLGLKMPSGHTVMNAQHWNNTDKDFTEAWKYTVGDAAVVGQQYVISPWLDEKLRKSEDDIKRFMEVFNKCGELCKKSGMKFGYHNHDFEFSQKFGDHTVYDIILKNTDPDLVIQQLDIGNLYNGGATALEVMSKFPKRFQSMHVKDEIKAESGNEKYESTILGKGIVPVKDVIDLGRKSGGTIHFIVEQESYGTKSAMDCIKEDFQIMKNWGY